MKNKVESQNNHTLDGSQYDLEFMRGRIEYLGGSGHQNARALAEYLDLAQKLFWIPSEKPDRHSDKH